MPDLIAKDVTGISVLPHRRFCLGPVANLPLPGDKHPCSDNMIAMVFGDAELSKDGDVTITVHYEYRAKGELKGGLNG